MADDKIQLIQHQPLRVPKAFDNQERAFVMQLENLLDDIYRRFSIYDKKIKDLTERVSELEGS